MVEPVLDTVPVEVLELLADPVMVGEAVFDLDGSAVLEAKEVRVAAPVLEGVLVPFAVVVIDGLRVYVIVVVVFDFPVTDTVPL